MKPNPRKDNVINLNDKIDYNTRFTKSLNDLIEIENNIKEMAVNLVMSDEYSNWNRNAEVGKIIELNDSIWKTVMMKR